MNRFQYLLLLAGCLILTAPLEPAFRVRVWRSPRRLARALLPPLVIFVAWDVVAIHRGDWGYDPRYVTGLDLPFRLPVEEFLFFLVIPICAVLTFEVVSKILGRFRRG